MARPENIIQGDTWRITVLTDRLLRLEYDPQGRYTDAATQTVLCRDFPPVPYTVTRHSGEIELNTGAVRLFYDGQPFSPEGLRAEMVQPTDPGATRWVYGQPTTNLGGTVRTLDDVDGAIPLEPGLMSRSGFAVLEDSKTATLTPELECEPRREGITDLYLFAYSHDYQDCLHAFYRLTGPVPLLPRYALGNWWSRFYVYSEETYLQLMQAFRDHGVPLSVAVLDIDWHPTKIPASCGSGWTGYSWNRDLFPDPESFLKKLHQMGLKVSLNLHPAEGVGAHEDAYPAMCEALGRDPSTGDRIPFDCTDPAYMDAYFQILHHPLEKQGVDFWWVDWQQGTRSSKRGIDPLWVLTHRHYLDSGREGRWPLTLSRYASIGSHRYPLGFSGDTHITWASLDFQPYFTATASNAGYPWWSHDIGGHMRGIRDDELTARWVQFGCFSPILRLHSSCTPFSGKEPWNYGAEACRVMTDFLRLRKKLIPYLYSMNYRTHREGLPLLRPLYYTEDTWDAYNVPNEYRFGTEMIVCAITAPADKETGMASFDAFLPKGLFFDFFINRVYTGDRKLTLSRPLDTIPVLVPAGGIIPLDGDAQSFGADNPERMELRVYPGADGSFTLYEDSGIFGATPAETRFTLTWGNIAVLTAEVSGDVNCIPENRTYRIILPCVESPKAVSTDLYEYDPAARTLTIAFPAGRRGFTVSWEASIAPPDPTAEIFEILRTAQMAYDLKDRIWNTVRSTRDPLQQMAKLTALHLREPLFAAITEPILAAVGLS